MTQARSCDLCTLLSAPSDALIWQDGQLSVVLVDEANYPGFVRVVWNQHVKEMTDLAPEERTQVMNAVWQVEAAVREVMAPAKVNLASFGNMTPHVHWHVIPRYTDDVHFPNPTWGEARRAPDPAALAARGALLVQLRESIIARLAS